MKKIAMLATVVLPFILSAQNIVTIQGNIKDLKAGEKVYYSPYSSNDRDSVLATAGHFTIHIKIGKGEGDAYSLSIGSDRFDENAYQLLFLDKGTVTITGNGPHFKDAKLSGPASIQDLNAYHDFLKNDPQMGKQDSLYKLYHELSEKHDTVALKALNPQLEMLDSMRIVLNKQWVKAHPAEPLSAYIISLELLYFIDINDVETLINGLQPSAKNNVPAKKVLHSIEVDKLTRIGKTALDFTQADTAGKPVSLKDFRGKYVLIDFWASWCHPCREENPNVVKAYNTYKDKNFTVLSISFDEVKNSWLKAIQKDGLAWTQVSDLKGWNNAVGKVYDIESIPSNLLIDPTGKIIGKNLRGDDLNSKLAEVLSN